MLTCVLCGVLITVCTAGPAAFLYEYLGGHPTSLHSRSVPPEFKFFGPDAIRRLRWPFKDEWTYEYPGDWVYSGAYSPPPLTDDPPAWVHNADGDDYTKRQQAYFITTTGSGWPLRAFSHISWDIGGKSVPTAPDNPQLEHAWRIKSIARGNFPPLELIIPTSPIWPGLIADTAIWSAASALLLFGLKQLRATHRRRRNRCPHCNYARVGLAQDAPCPKCGRSPA